MNVSRERPKHTALARVSLILGLLGVVTLAACAGTQFRDSVVDTGAVRYRMPPPEADFKRVEIADYDLAYTHKRWGTMGVHATCRDFEDVPAKALLNQLLFGTTERKRELLETVTLDDRGALHARYRLALDGVPITLEVFVVNKNGCLFDFSLVTGVPSDEASRKAFGTWVQGFVMLGRAR